MTPKLKVVDDDAWRWQTSGAKEAYDVNKYYVKSTNNHDHSGSVHVKMEKGLMAEIWNVVNSGIIDEYDSFTDFLRDAAYHRMEHLRPIVNDPNFDKFVDSERRRAVFDRIKREQDQQFYDLEDIKLRLQTAQQRADKAGLDAMLEYCESELGNFRDPYLGQLIFTMKSYGWTDV